MIKEKKDSVILMPNHRSDIDFLMLTYINFYYGIDIPYVCATENFLNISFITSILRKTGGFFFNQDHKGDDLYRACVYEYIKRLVGSKAVLEHFIEMQRSKSGKISRAKIQVLPYFVDAYLANPVTDIKFVPITMNYDRVHEGESFPMMLLGEERSMNSFGATVKSLIYCRDNYGK